jgi:hypothetical protein
MSRPSPSRLFRDTRGSSYYLIMEVEGHGALVIRSSADPSDPEGKLKLNGVSTFSQESIRSGHA